MDIKAVNMDDQKHKGQIYQLWESVLDDIWPVEKQNFDDLVFNQNSRNFIVKNGSEIIGHLSAQICGETAALVCVLVEKTHQGKGVGSKLVEEAMKELKQRGIRKISLGSGGYSYFWPGVPTNLKPAVMFFKKLGWNYSETSVDMIGQLKNYQTPSGIYQRVENLEIKIEFLNESQINQLKEFEKQNFSDWYGYFSAAIEENKLDNVLIALSSDNQILGSVLIDRNKKAWNRILGDRVGALGALGVSESARGQGIGLALAAKGSEILKDSEVEVCFLGWTRLIDWYGKLGYKVWREYQMATKNI